MEREINKVCFVERYATSLFVQNRATDEIGGAEIQQYLLAKELVARGMRAGFILDDDPRITEGVVDGIELLKSYDSRRGVRFVRYVYPRARLLWRALSRADADLYYVRGARDISGVVAHFCRMKRRIMFHAIANDSDCVRRLYEEQGLRAAAYLHGLRRATRVLAQTDTQQRMLREHHAIDSVIVRNVMPLPELRTGGAARPVRRVLWVGTVRPSKRPDWLLALARRFPGLEFEMIGPRTRHEARYFEEIVRAAESLPNVRHIPFVPFAEIGAHFERADVLVLTSRREGFPNALLQSWACARPVVSTWDPDGVIARHHMGVAVSGLEEAAAALERICADPAEAARMGMNGRRYVEEHHSPRAVVDRLLGLAATEARTPPP